jgi:hypothetical protein
VSGSPCSFGVLLKGSNTILSLNPLYDSLLYLISLVCPWHRYDFDLKTGKSETGLRACTYDVQLREPQEDSDKNDKEMEVWVEAPGGGPWEIVELRPVSESTDPLQLNAIGPQMSNNTIYLFLFCQSLVWLCTSFRRSPNFRVID